MLCFTSNGFGHARQRPLAKVRLRRKHHCPTAGLTEWVSGNWRICGRCCRNKNAFPGNFSSSGEVEPTFLDALFRGNAPHKLFQQWKTGTDNQAVTPSRSSKRATVIGCQRLLLDTRATNRSRADCTIRFPKRRYLHMNVRSLVIFGRIEGRETASQRLC
jgi:hypothetical protein